jgi:hypothetical protein
MVGKVQKSHEARSGLYGGCSNGVPPIHIFQAEHRIQFISRPHAISVASQQVFIIIVFYFVIDSVRKLLDISSYSNYISHALYPSATGDATDVAMLPHRQSVTNKTRYVHIQSVP